MSFSDLIKFLEVCFLKLNFWVDRNIIEKMCGEKHKVVDLSVKYQVSRKSAVFFTWTAWFYLMKFHNRFFYCLYLFSSLQSQKGKTHSWILVISFQMFWSKEELDMLRSSSIHQEIIDQKAHLEKEFLALKPVSIILIHYLEWYMITCNNSAHSCTWIVYPDLPIIARYECSTLILPLVPEIVLRNAEPLFCCL